MTVAGIDFLKEILDGKIKVDKIEVNITPREDHPIGMPMSKFKVWAGANGKAITHKTICEWQKSGKIIVERMSRNHTYVIQFGRMKWNGEKFEQP